MLQFEMSHEVNTNFKYYFHKFHLSIYTVFNDKADNFNLQEYVNFAFFRKRPTRPGERREARLYTCRKQTKQLQKDTRNKIKLKLQ